jgi:anti-sigma-K factor RskA
VSGCRNHGELIGGYVLGALEPSEMDAMGRHLEACPACAAEVGALDGLPRLLDRIEPADVPPPALSPGVEEAVLDRYARERRPRRRRDPRHILPGRWPRWAPAGVALLAALALALVLFTTGDDTDSAAYATVRLAPPSGDSQARGVAYADAVPAGTRVRLWARGLAAARVYELWCVRPDGHWVSGGTFGAGRDGRARAELTAAVKPGDYHVMVVTRHAERRAEGARGTPVLRGPLRY